MKSAAKERSLIFVGCMVAPYLSVGNISLKEVKPAEMLLPIVEREITPSPQSSEHATPNVESYPKETSGPVPSIRPYVNTARSKRAGVERGGK